MAARASIVNGLNTPLDSVMQLQNTGSVSSAIFVHMDLLPFLLYALDRYCTSLVVTIWGQNIATCGFRVLLCTAHVILWGLRMRNEIYSVNNGLNAGILFIVPLHFFGCTRTISGFGERFHDGQYILASFLSVPRFPRAQPFVKVGGDTWPRVPCFRH